MKKPCPPLLLTGLAVALAAPAGRALVTISGPVTLYIGPGGLVPFPTYMTLSSGATFTNEGPLALGGDFTSNGTFTAPITPAALLLASGMYLLRVTTAGTNQVLKLVR